MKTAVLNKIVVSLTLLFLLLMLTATHAVAASSDPVKAKKEAEAKGYIFFATHDEIVAMAKKEGKLRVMIGLEPQTSKPLMNAFKQKYPFITDLHVQEISGTEAYQRVLLEMKSGQAMEWDIVHLPLDFAKAYMPYLMKHEILGMAKHGVLKIDPRMVHPGERNIIGVISTVKVVPYNRKLISEDKVPAQWEDFLKPEFKGRKFLMDIRPIELGALVPAWGLERTLDFARKIAAQQPVWARGATRYTTAIAAGEYSFAASINFSVLKQIMSKDPTGNLSYKTIEPVPTRAIDDGNGILNTASHPHAALLWFEFLASPEGQEIIDKYELEASVFTPGSVHEQVTRGKKLSLVDWDHVTKFEEYVKKISAAQGFPKAEK
ncbi:MAG: ABC transporter substrate-binding protein [Deltaproteobacteria bacterium]|nr:ABC transporter substrate-binding protein [Deltaproteobacteria bacterium]